MKILDQITCTRMRLYLTETSNMQIVYIAACVFLFSFFNDFSTSAFIKRDYYNGFYFILPISLLGARLTYQNTPASYKILLRSIIAIALFYVTTGHVSIPDDILLPDKVSGAGLNIGWSTAVICGFLAMKRPSFGLVTLQYISWEKYLLRRIYDLPLTHADYITIIDTGSLLIFGAMLLTAMHWGIRRMNLPPSSGTIPVNGIERLHPLELLLLCGVALHFGNYYYGAMIKMALGDHVLFWAMENHTYFLSAMALENSVMPLSFNPALTQTIYDKFSSLYVLFNFLTLLGQAFCIIAITRVRWTILITLFYDLMHISIFLLTGIFFWKWILLNLAIVVALSKFRNKLVPSLQKIMLVLLVAVAPQIFNIPLFGWLDSPALNSVKLYAITKDHREIRVPANYMLGMSVTFQQQIIVWPNEGPFRTLVWGTTYEPEEMRAALTCSNKPNTVEDRHPFYISREKITNAIQTHHKLVLSLLDAAGQFEYDLYPHHILSMPWYFREFKKLDKRLIVGYRYEIDSICVKYENKEIIRERKNRDSFIISIDGHIQELNP